MYKEYAKELIKLMHEIYNEQKRKVNFAVKGDMATLLYIYNERKTYPKAISKALNVSTARVAAVLNSLEEKEYITRKISKEDRRQIKINITNKGEQRAEKIIDDHMNIAALIFKKLGEKDTKKSIELLNKVKNILNDLNINKLEGDEHVTT